MTPLDLDAVRRAFGRAAPHYEASAVLQREVQDRLLERLEYVARPPPRVLDLGSGPGRSSAVLQRRYPKAQVIALDAALPMLRQARRAAGWWRPFARVAGVAEALPLAEQSVDLVFSSLCLQWCPDLPRVFGEVRRVLRPGGMFLMSTFGPETLHELRAAWSAADGAPHVNRFVDMPVIGDALMHAGFRDPVLDIETLTLTYSHARDLMRELKAIGASNADTARSRSLGGRARLQRVLQAYEAFRRDGSLPASYEVIYAHAFGPEPGQPRRAGSGEIASFAIDRLRGSRRPKPGG